MRTRACAAGLHLGTTALGKPDGKSHLSRGNGAKKKGTEQPQAEQGSGSVSCKLQFTQVTYVAAQQRHSRAGGKGGKSCQLQHS